MALIKKFVYKNLYIQYLVLSIVLCTNFKKICTKTFSQNIYQFYYNFQNNTSEYFLDKKFQVKNDIEIINFARNQEKKGFYFQALSLYKFLCEKYTISLLAPEAYYRSGIILYKLHQFDKVLYFFNKVIKKYPNYFKYNEILYEQYKVIADNLQSNRYYALGLLPIMPKNYLMYKCINAVIKNNYNDYFLFLKLIHDINISYYNKDHSINFLNKLTDNYPKNIIIFNIYSIIAKFYQKISNRCQYDITSILQFLIHYKDSIFLFPNNIQILNVKKYINNAKNILASNKFSLANFYYSYCKNQKAASLYYNEVIRFNPNPTIFNKACKQINKIKKLQIIHINYLLYQ